MRAIDLGYSGIFVKQDIRNMKVLTVEVQLFNRKGDNIVPWETTLDTEKQTEKQTKLVYNYATKLYKKEVGDQSDVCRARKKLLISNRIFPVNSLRHSTIIYQYAC